MAVHALAAGVDTWGPSWRVQLDTPLARRLDEQASVPTAMGGKMVPERIHGHRVMYWPESGLLKAEGHPLESGLAPVASLPHALADLIASMTDAGVPPPPGARRFRRFRESEGFAGLRRCDLTVDLRVDERDEGRLIMAAAEAAARASGLYSPRYQRANRAGDTVYQRNAGGVTSRLYDKGVESGTAEPYRLLRPESQWNYRADERAIDVEDLAEVDAMRGRFAKRWGPSFRTRIVIGDMTELGRELAKAVRAGRLTPSEARRIGGYLLTEPFGGLAGDSRATRHRLRTEAAAFGFHLVDGVLEPLEVDLGAVFDEAERPELWESGLVGHVEPVDAEETELRARMRERLDGHAARPLPTSDRTTDNRWREGRSGRKSPGPATPAPLPEQLADRPPRPRRAGE